MDSVILDMEVIAIPLRYGKALRPFVELRVVRMQIAQATDRPRGRDLAMHVGFRMFGHLMCMPLQAADL